MSKPQPIGPVMIDVKGLTLSAYDREKIAHPNTGALILFSRNYESPQQVTELIAAIRVARNGPILIAVDQEGGRVQRFRSGFTRLPPAAALQDVPELAESAGWLMAAEMLAVGVDFSFTPVLDVDCGVSEIIGNRAFSTDYAQVAELADAFRRGMRRAGMAATGKHFPGHGAVASDSHLTLPIDDRDLDTIRSRDLVPFARLIANGLEAVMPAHVVYPAVDRQPAGFSERWLRDVLRGELQFDGVIFSDDLSMAGAAVAGSFEERAGLALQAGCDMVLVCNDPDAAEQVLDCIPIRSDPTRERRLQAMVGQSGSTLEVLMQNPSWQRIAEQLTSLSNHYA